MLRIALSSLKPKLALEHFSTHHALVTALILLAAYAFTFLFTTDQDYWLLLTSLLFSQAGLRNELQWQTPWQTVYYFLLGLLAASLVTLLTLVAAYFFLTAAILLLTTFTCTYLGTLDRRYFFATFTLNLLALVTACTSPSDQTFLAHLAWQRFDLILLAGTLVFVLRLALFLYQRTRRSAYAWPIFLQKLNTVYEQIFNREEDEGRYQIAWSNCLAALQELPKQKARLEKLWELTLSLGSLRYRITDKPLLSIAEREFKALATALNTLLATHLNQADFTPLDLAIQDFETLYQNTLQTATEEPLLLLLFIQDLHSLKEELESLALLPPSELTPTKIQNIPSPPRFAWRRGLGRGGKHSIRSTTAIFLALSASFTLSGPHNYWLFLLPLILTQTEIAQPLQQSLQRCLTLVLLILVSTQIVLTLNRDAVFFLVLLATMATAYWYAYTSRRDQRLPLPLLALTTLSLALILPLPALNLPKLLDLLFGSLIGLASTLFIFPDKPTLEFQNRVLPLLKNLSSYLNALGDLLLHKSPPDAVAKPRNALEALWAKRDDFFPTWAFNPGFNPALRPGQQYFLIHLGQCTEILFAMNHFARPSFDDRLLEDLRQPLSHCLSTTESLFANLLALLNGDKIQISETDFIQDLNTLEASFHQAAPLSLELLDLSRDHAYLAAFIRYLKDLRLQLLQLVSALR